MIGKNMAKLEYRKELDSLNTYVPGKPIEEVQKEYQLDKVIKLASNENPLGTSPKAIEALKEAANKVHIYPDGGSTEIKEALADLYEINTNQIVLGNGSDELLVLIAMAFLNKGDEVLISKQTFSEYAFASKCMGAKISYIEQQNFTYDLKAFKEKISDKTKVIFFCNPNNPTGTIFTKEEFDSFMKEVPENVLVVVDEAYYEYVENKAYPQTLKMQKEYPNIIILRTFSKIYGLAGLRIGYGISSPYIIECINKVREPFNVNLMAQKAAIAAIKDQEYLNTVRSTNTEVKKYLYNQFDSLNIKYIKSESNFVIFETDNDSKIIFEKLLKKGIIVRSMTGFGLPNHIRVTAGTLDETKTFIKCLKEIL